jgi:hypothetical protein
MQPAGSQPGQGQQARRAWTDRGRRRWLPQSAAVLVLGALLLAGHAGAASWDDDTTSSGSSSSSGSGIGSTLASSPWGSVGIRQSADGGGAGSRGLGVVTPGPPPAPTRSGDAGDDAARKSHNKNVDATPGFSGGFLPPSRRCNNPSLPGCQSCNGDVCNACYAVLGDASFVLDTTTKQCSELLLGSGGCCCDADWAPACKRMAC